MYTVQRKILEWSKFLHISNTIQIVQKLEPTKSSVRDNATIRFFLVRQLFVYYDAPDVLVNMVGAYHCLDGERTMHRESKNSN